VIESLNTLDFGPKTVVVRVNGTDTPHYYQDLIAVVEGAGARLDAIMLPKVRTPGDVEMTDKLLTQIELASGFEVGRIGIEAQIEDATGLVACEAIALASPRMETLIFGPGDYSASIGIPITTIGAAPDGYPGDHLNYVYTRLVVAARAHDKPAIDGPYLQIRDVDGFKRVAGRSAALGFDGKWVLHPDQIAAANEVYSPLQADYDHAENILDAYEHFTSEAGGATGAVMLGDEMIDEASRKMALVISAKGRAAGMERTDVWKASE